MTNAKSMELVDLLAEAEELPGEATVAEVTPTPNTIITPELEIPYQSSPTYSLHHTNPCSSVCGEYIGLCAYKNIKEYKEIFVDDEKVCITNWLSYYYKCTK
ncbi:MAG: hypothetical protein Nk1A_2700 [Endomicrobiia bacterium]|nr:MAG: hypothetical protein Nk1A_2700 [Endomicrobiia bacterium]